MFTLVTFSFFIIIQCLQRNIGCFLHSRSTAFWRLLPVPKYDIQWHEQGHYLRISVQATISQSLKLVGLAIFVAYKICLPLISIKLAISLQKKKKKKIKLANQTDKKCKYSMQYFYIDTTISMIRSMMRQYYKVSWLLNLK